MRLYLFGSPDNFSFYIIICVLYVQSLGVDWRKIKSKDKTA